MGCGELLGPAHIFIFEILNALQILNTLHVHKLPYKLILKCLHIIRKKNAWTAHIQKQVFGAKDGLQVLF